MGFINETLEEVGRVWSFLGRVKATLVAFSCLGIGVFLYAFAPPKLQEEIPYHQEVGIGCAAFGLLLVLALFFDRGRGSIGLRAKWLVAALACGAIAGVCGYGLYLKAHPAWRLAQEGRVATAEVLSVRMVTDGKSWRKVCHVAVAGQRGKLTATGLKQGSRVQVRWPATATWQTLRQRGKLTATGLKQGSRVQVRYVPGLSPVVLASAGSSFLDLLDDQLGLGYAALFGLMTLVFGGYALVKLHDMVTGCEDPVTAESS